MSSRVDLGTPELAAKRLLDYTKEPLDLFREKGLIDNDQHYAGMKFRCLHYIFFGTPNATAYDIEYEGRTTFASYEPEDQEWLEKKNMLYKQAASMLREHNVFQKITDVCIYQYKPRFLEISILVRHNKLAISKESVAVYNQELHYIQEGLDLLAKLFQQTKY